MRNEFYATLAPSFIMVPKHNTSSGCTSSINLVADAHAIAALHEKTDKRNVHSAPITNEPSIFNVSFRDLTNMARPTWTSLFVSAVSPIR